MLFLIEYDGDGFPDKITPEPLKNLTGTYVEQLPISIETMLEQGTVEEIVEQGITKYKIIKEI